MSKIRLILLSMLVVFAASAIASASASAANGCEELGGEKCLWTLNGSPFLSGIRTLKPIWNSTQTLKGTAGAVAVTLVSKLIDLEKTTILGGIPGDGRANILFKNVEVVKPTGCAVNGGTVITKPLITELVELVKAGTPQKVDDVLFLPEGFPTNKIFAELEFQNNPNCGINGVKANVEGTIQAEPIPRGKETKLLTLKAQGAAAWEFRRKGEATATASQLTLGGKNAIYEGSVDIEKVGGLEWGTD